MGRGGWRVGERIGEIKLEVHGNKKKNPKEKVKFQSGKLQQDIHTVAKTCRWGGHGSDY